MIIVVIKLYRSSNTTENVCPWELDDDILTHKQKDKDKDKGHVRRGSDPTNVKSSGATATPSAAKPVGRTVGAIAAVATSALTTPLEAAKLPPTKRSSSTVSEENKLDPAQKCSPHDR